MTNLNRFSCNAAIATCISLALLSGCNQQSGSSNVSSTTIGTEVDDSVITTKINTGLMSNEAVKSLDIKVKTHKGEVLLSGFVDNQDQIDLASAIANGIDGVKSVDNRLSLKQGNQSVGHKIDDSIITAQVKSAMLADPVMKSLEVSVSTRNGEVELSGFVDNSEQMTHARNIAKGTNGVSSVVNHMSLKK